MSAAQIKGMASSLYGGWGISKTAAESIAVLCCFQIGNEITSDRIYIFF
jgi:hypothetical protein